MIEHALDEETGTICNALGGKIRGTGPIQRQTSCLAASQATRQYRSLDFHEPAGLGWFLVSSASARHDAHVDVGGGYTLVDPEAGGKFWMTLVPDVDHSTTSSSEIERLMCSTGIFLKYTYGVPQSVKGYRWEAIHLTPGMTL